MEDIVYSRHSVPTRLEVAYITNKEFYFIITAAETDLNMMERSIECFRGLLDCLENPTEKGVIYGVGAWQKGEIKGTKAMKEAYEMGKNV